MRVCRGGTAAAALLLLALGACQQADTASQADAGFCEAIQDYASAEDCAALEKQAEQINPAGRAAFSAPYPMQRGERFTVTLAVADTPPPAPPAPTPPAAAAAPRPPPPEPEPEPEPVEAPDEENIVPAGAAPIEAGLQPPAAPRAPTPSEVIQALPGRKLEYDLSVGPRMVAELEGDAGFEVTAISPREQRVHMGPPYASTVWSWQVAAKRGGAHTLSIKTAVQAIDSQGKLHELAATPQVYSFTVIANWPGTWIDQMAGWTDDLKQATSFTDALKGFVVAVIGLLGALGLKKLWDRRRKARDAPPSQEPDP